MIDLQIDGRKAQVEEGARILDAARKAEVYVPTLCDHPDLRPYGGCRLCVVEIEGRPGSHPACITTAQDGMVVRTNTDAIQKLRRGVLELLLCEHPSACLVCEERHECWTHHECTGRAEATTGCNFCPKGYMCELRQVVQHVFGDAGPEITVPSLYRGLPIDRRDPFIDRDDNLCILCGRCVRACEEIGRTNTLDFVYRGSEARVGTAFNRTLLESGCRFCGSCVDACPTGSLSERVRRWDGAADQHVQTTCSFCSVGCQFDLGVKHDGVIEALPRRDGPVNQGDNCVRGRFSVVEFVRSIKRPKSPMIRRNGDLVEVPWQTALDAAAEGIRRAKPERSALLYSGSCTNESIYYAHKFARDVLETRNVDSSVRLSYGPLLNGHGNGSEPARISDLTDAAAVLVIGADPSFSHPVLAEKLKRAIREGGTSLVLMSPHETVLSGLATCEIQYEPGGERQVLDSLSARMGGESAAVPEDVERAADVLEDAKKKGSVLVLFGSGVMRRREGTRNGNLISAVARALGAKVLPLLSAANDRGAIEMAAFFGCDGMTVPEVHTAAREGGLDLLYLMGEDLSPGKYDAGFVIVQDLFPPSEALEIADVVFPVSSFAEVDGTYTNMEGRVQRVRAAARRTLGAMSDCEVLSRLAGKLEKAGFEHEQPSAVMAEVAETVPFYGGATHDALDGNGAFFGHEQAGRKVRAPVDVRRVRTPKTEIPDKDYPFLLIAELDEYTYRATPLASHVPGLRRIEPAGTVSLSPHDAEAMGVETGMPVSIVSRRGKVSAHAAVSERAREGVARMVARGGEGSLMTVLDGVFDPDSKAPEEICAVRIERI
jgi:predicted molibdopterin-dependent oxidoreductase YjgC